MTHITLCVSFGLLLAIATACSNDNSSPVSEAIQHGVGAECALTSDCATAGSTCLTQFKGGYCGLSGCTADSECPAGSLCVAHTDGANYCFLSCLDKIDCNPGRSVDNESNCVANIAYVESVTKGKACLPPNGG